ncbi:hypothetical protein ACHQM5_028144 [Ranunculus cassubicifolius]
MAFSVSIEELMSFHSIDREVFTRLVNQLRLDPALAMWVMALWLTLEELGYPTVILALDSSTPDNLVIALFHEAVSILNFLQAENPPSLHTRDAIPNTYHIMGGHISLQDMYETRVALMNDVVKTYSKVCSRVFADISPPNMNQGSVGQTLGMNMGSQQVEEPAKGVAPDGKFDVHVLPHIPHSFHPGFRPVLHFRGVGPVFFPSVQGHFEVGESSNSQVSNPRSNGNHFEFGESSNIQAYNPSPIANEITPDRTLFMTFSRGFPVSEAELLEFFTRNYGNVIQVIYMEETAADVEPLWAHVVFRNRLIVAQIMNGHDRVKLMINGKLAWARGIVQFRRV